MAAKLTAAIGIIARSEQERKEGKKTKQNALVLHRKKRLRIACG